MKHVIWFTGLSGSGKTTIANVLVYEMRKRGIPAVLLDGDEIRRTFSKDLGYTKEDRDKNITRVADVCYSVVKNDVMVIACVLSPTREIRRYARKLIKNFIEVYVKCSIEECKKRDVKGHWTKAKNGIIKDFVGINVPYEEPAYPEIVVETDKELIRESVEKIIKYLEDERII